jgi:hypothetical protein
VGNQVPEIRRRDWSRRDRHSVPDPGALSGVGILRSQKQLMSSSQCGTLNNLGPRFRGEAASWETPPIEQRHEDNDPSLAQDAHRP